MSFHLIQDWGKRPLVTLTSVIAALLSIWMMRELAAVLIPVALAVLTALVVEPIDRTIRRRLPAGAKWLSSVAATLSVVAALALAGGLCWMALQPALEQSPQYTDKLNDLWRNAAGWLEGNGVPVDEMLRNGDASQYVASLFSGIASSMWQTGAMVLLAGLLLLLFLLEADTWRGKLQEALEGDKASKAIEAIESVQQKLVTYLWIHTLVSLLGGATVALWLWIMGVPFAALWGFLFFVLNYVPNVGSIIAAGPPLVMSLLTGDLSHMLIVGSGLFVNEQLTGNLLASIVEGRRLMISPAVTLIALTFWTWMWGVPGAFLTLPLTVTLITVMSYIPPLQPIALLASDTSNRRRLLRWRRPTEPTAERA